MDQLLSKLTNLGYEAFGILIPGLILGLFVLFWWIGLGGLAPLATSGFLPEMTLIKAANVLEKTGDRSAIGAAAVYLISTYFLGHILQRLSRSGKANEGQLRSWTKRTTQALRFNILRPENSFDPKLNTAYEKIKIKLEPNNLGLEWPQFYPIAKNFVARNSSSSLITTYQNKYTLQRSITMAAALLFWGCTAALITGAVVNYHLPEISFRWGVLLILIFTSLLVAGAFSGGFAYNWTLLGNSVITEAYSLLYGPDKNDQS